MAHNPRKKKLSQIICFCNNVARDVIEDAITKGAQSLNEIYDQTTAGVGPCGGSCRKKIAPILESYLTQGTFTDGGEPNSGTCPAAGDSGTSACPVRGDKSGKGNEDE